MGSYNSMVERIDHMFHYLPFFLNIPEEDYYLPMAGASLGAFIIFGLLLTLVLIIGVWKVYEKAGKPGWTVLIPFYNTYVLLEIIGRPWWWLILLLIPGVNLVLFFMMVFELGRSFNKSAAFGLGLIFLQPIFLLILGFGDAEYAGPAVPG